MSNLNMHSRAVLQAVQLHPRLMSPVLLEHLLRGEIIGRMVEKGLSESPCFGLLANLPAGAVFHLVQGCLEAGWVAAGSGYYPALSLTASGEALFARACGLVSERSPEAHYRAYYRWRQGVARSRRTPPYRIFPNATLNELGVRMPTTLEELLEVPGLGKRRALRYQEDLLAVGRKLREDAAMQPAGV